MNLAFLRYLLPFPEYARALDVCCGLGRHAVGLSAEGYEVLGIDIDEELVAEAASLHPDVAFLNLDMRQLDDVGKIFDGVICLWQSFGYFDEDTNAAVLGSMAERLRPGGRLVFDLYNREWFEVAEHRDFELNANGIFTSSHFSDPRLTVDLTYGTGATERFDWQLFTPSELQAIGTGFGLRPVVACANWNAETPPTDEIRDFQIVLEKV